MEKMGGIMIPLILLPPALVDFKSLNIFHKVLQTSCDIVFLYCLLLPLLHWIHWSSCTEHVTKFYSMEILMKLPFQRVVIYPKRTPDEEVMVDLLRHCALSRDISERAALKDFTITLHTDSEDMIIITHIIDSFGSSPPSTYHWRLKLAHELHHGTTTQGGYAS